MKKRLTDKEARWVIEHAMRSHSAAERERLAGMTDVETLRAALLEVGLPADEVDRSIASVDQIIAQRKSGSRALGWLLALVVGAAVGAAVWFAWPQPDPGVFVNIKHERPDRQAFHSFEGGAPTGEPERIVAKALAARGLPSVRVSRAAVGELFVGAALHPSLAAIRGKTAATLALLGTERCRRTKAGFRATLLLELFDLDSEQAIARADAHAIATGAAEAACAAAAKQAATRAAADLAAQLKVSK